MGNVTFTLLPVEQSSKPVTETAGKTNHHHFDGKLKDTVLGINYFVRNEVIENGGDLHENSIYLKVKAVLP